MIDLYVDTIEYDGNKTKREAEHEAGISLLQHAVHSRYGITSDQLVCDRSHKPFFVSHPEIQFNISHSRGKVVCALSTAPVGVDIEQIRVCPDALLRKMLGKDEAAMFAREDLTPQEKNRLFTRLWTLKESYVKATGCGLTVPLDRVTFSFKDGDIESSVNGYCFRQIFLEDSYVISICRKGAKTEPVRLISLPKNQVDYSKRMI